MNSRKVGGVNDALSLKGGQFISHAKMPPGNLYEGHTLAVVILETEKQLGASIRYIVADRACRGHRPNIASRSISPSKTARHQRRSNASCAVEPVIGHLKGEHRLVRDYLAHAAGRYQPRPRPRRI